MAEYQSGGHTLHDIKYHLVWITKYRYQVLRGAVAERARDVIREICMAREVQIIRGSLAPDHVHMLVSCPPKLAPAKRRRYWGQHLWARGYFCATVGAVDEETIKAYIESQRWADDGGEAFKVTPPPSP